MSVRVIRAARLAAVGLLLAAAGCGAGTADVTGTVKYDGTPLDLGAITFVPDGDGKAAKVSTRFYDGKYTIPAADGLKPGKYKVEINWLKKTGKQIPTGDGPPMDERKEGLPDKYHQKSTLTADVKGGPNTLDFALEK